MAKDTKAKAAQAKAKQRQKPGPKAVSKTIRNRQKKRGKTGRKANQPWDIMKGETSKAYRAFCIYQSLGPGRSIRRTGLTLGHSTMRHIEVWAVKNSWVKRAAEWDRHVFKHHQDALEDEHAIQLERFRDRLIAMHNKSLDRVEETLELARHMLDAAYTIEDDGTVKLHVAVDKLPSFMRAAASVGTMATEAAATALGVDEVLDYSRGEE